MASATAVFGRADTDLAVKNSGVFGQTPGRSAASAQRDADDLFFSGPGCPDGDFAVTMNVFINGTVDLGDEAPPLQTGNIGTYELDVRVNGQEISGNSLAS